MSNNAIFIPGQEDSIDDNQIEQPNQEYLTVDGSLREIAERGTAETARGYLNVCSKTEIEDLTGGLQTRIDEYIDQSSNVINEVQKSLENIQQDLNSFVKKDGTTPFDNVPSVENDLLITSSKLKENLEGYSTNNKVNNLRQEIIDRLNGYASSKDIYKKEDLYNKNAIDDKLLKYIKYEDINKKQINGAYPKFRTNLATKGYVDDIIKAHRTNEPDPHNLKAYISTKLSDYYKKSEIYTKAQTYSRVQLDEIIDNLISEACKSLIDNHISNTLHLSSSEVRQIIKAYAQSNLIDRSDLETLQSKIDSKIDNIKPTWKTSGPVLTTVGFVEDNSELPAEMTMQEILDAIFYGSKISLDIQSFASLGSTVDITMCIHSGIPTDSIELYQDGKLIESFDDIDFVDGCVTIQSQSLTEDAEFKFKVLFANGLTQEEVVNVKVVAPSFVGLLPQWKFGNVVTMEYLKELVAEDKTNNKFVEGIPSEIIQKYSFQDSQLKHPFVVVPANNPDLEGMVTKSQNFGLEAFNIIDMIPLRIKDKDIMYKMYIYKQALSSLNQEITFKFKV